MAEVKDNSSIQLFEDQKIRTAWDAEKEEWYFAIVDVIAVVQFAQFLGFQRMELL